MSETQARAFDERLTIVYSTLRRWIYRTYGYNFPETDDCLQAASIELWQVHRREPERLDTTSDALWVVIGRYAIRSYLHRVNRQVCRRQGKRCTQRRAQRVIFTESELISQHDGQDEREDLISLLTFARSDTEFARHCDNADICQADLRMDLEGILKAGFAVLDKRYHGNMRKLMEDVMLGYKLVESRERHGWTQNQAATLMRLMRNVFRGTTTAKKLGDTTVLSCKPTDTADEMQRIRKLRKQGLSYTKIGRLIGRSTSFVQHQLKEPVPRDFGKAQHIHALRQQGLSYTGIGRAVGCSKAHVQRVLNLTESTVQ